MIKQYTLTALEAALNQALALDEDFPAKIKPLVGKIIRLNVKPLGLYFFMQFFSKGIKLTTECAQEADTIIESSPLGLIRLSVLPVSKVRSLFNDHIQMTGNVEIGQAIKKMFDEIQIDWEGHLARLTGDMVAYRIGSWVRQGIALGKNVRHSLQENLGEYLQEELRSTPPREELDDFFKDVDELALDVERLEAHIHQRRMANEIH
jgi:ubiquinone biosynthesis protein UbiJ